MRIVHINFDAGLTGGATIAMRRIHRALMQHDVDSLIVCRMLPDIAGSRSVPRGLWGRTMLFGWRVLMKLTAGCCRSTGLVYTGLCKTINSLHPDAVILHWIQNDTISVSELRKIKAPVFWFHHDLWPIRGVTAYEWFNVPPRLEWLDRLAKWNKQRIARLMGNRVVPVCASRWVSDEICKSGMYEHEPVVIPLPLDEVFRPGVRTPGHKFRILNGAQGGLDAGIKGGDRLLSALHLISEVEKQDMEVVIFGSEGKEIIQSGVPIRFVGRLHGEALAQAYRDADVFAFPSRQETFGQTKIEALACGTPVVAFDETACAEGIEHKKTGWIASPDNIAGYAEGIRYFYHAWKSGNAVRVEPRTQYGATVVAEQWLKMIRQEVSAEGRR